MAIEKRWAEIPTQPFIADGTENGIVTILNATGYYVKRRVAISAVGESDLRLEVKRVISPTQIIVGPIGKNLQSTTNLTAYTVAKISTIHAVEDKRPEIPNVDYERAVYDEEPIVAKRVVNVDEFGRYWNYSNPFPVSIEESVNPVPTIEKIVIIDIDKTNEASFTFPVDFDSYKIRVREANDEMRLAFNAGDIANGDYYTVDMGFEYESPQNKNFQSGKTIFMKGVNKNSSKVEIIYYY